jgi:hypothetical protein
MAPDKNILIAVIDLMLLLIIMLLLGVLAIRYDAEKGLGEKHFIPIAQVKQDNNEAVSNSIAKYNALIIDDKILEIRKVEGGNIIESRVFSNPSDLLKEIDKDETYVIYERNKSRFLGEIVRLFIESNIKILIAKPSKK